MCGDNVSLSVQNSLYNNPVARVQVKKQAQESPIGNAVIPQPIKAPSFGAAQNTTTPVRTQLTTNEEKQKYSQLVSVLDKKDKRSLEMLLKNGKLLNNNSNDKTTTLDNLHKILTNPRAEGLDAKVVLKETVATMANPFIITQRFGDMPKQYLLKAIAVAKEEDNAINAKSDPKTLEERENKPIDAKAVEVSHSGACVGASIEFDLASRMPAEFARFAEGLSSKNVSVEKNIKLSNLSENTLDAVWLLNAFEVPYEMNDFNTAKVTIAPDKGALLRAQIQNSHKDKLERSVVDVLMQSTFLNVGSQQTYNSLTDVRKGKFSSNNSGLIEFEKTFAESVIGDKNEISVVYQKIDDDGKLVGFEKDFATTKKEILDSLAIGQNVVIGYTFIDKDKNVIGGHEITIAGAKTGKDGKTLFICNDTDDNNPNPIEYSEDYIIPKIHHAGLPEAVAKKDNKYTEAWVDSMNAYKEAKNDVKNGQLAQAK